jgi:hypothetical protein
MENKHIDCFKQACKNVDASDVCRYTILYGSVEFLKCAHENGYPWDPLTLEYAIVKYLYEHVKREKFDDNSITHAMVTFGRLDILKYLYKQKVPFQPLSIPYHSLYS